MIIKMNSTAPDILNNVLKTYFTTSLKFVKEQMQIYLYISFQCIPCVVHFATHNF